MEGGDGVPLNFLVTDVQRLLFLSIFLDSYGLHACSTSAAVLLRLSITSAKLHRFVGVMLGKRWMVQ